MAQQRKSSGGSKSGGRRGGGRNIPLITSIVCTIGIIAALVAVVGTGAYNKVAESWGLPSLSIQQLHPDGDDMGPNDTGLRLPDIDMPDIEAPYAPDSAYGKNDTQLPEVTLPDGTGTGTGAGTAGTATDGGALPASSASPIGIQQALQIAQGMPTAKPHTQGYDREEQFGDWGNSDQLCGSGTTRDQILQRDMTDVVLNEKCQVESGTLRDPYTGDTIKFQRTKRVNGKTVSGDSTRVQIDHVVALNDAYASGLWKADHETQVAYANDPDVLMASDGDANNIKSNGVNLYRKGSPSKRWAHSTPSVWLPDYEPWRCDYMARRVYIKDKYDLTMSDWEKSETVAFLQQCPVG